VSISGGIAEGMMRSLFVTVILCGALAACEPTSSHEAVKDPNDFSALVAEPRTVTLISADITSRATTAEAVARGYLERIAAVDDAGPTLNAVLAVNPNALANS
jgi:amidase